MSEFHSDWYQQRYGDGQPQKQHRQNIEKVRAEYAELDAQRKERRAALQDNSAAILAEHQIEYEVRGHSWLCNVGYQQLYYWPKSGRWRVKGHKTMYHSYGAQDFLNKAQAWQKKQLS